MQPGGKLWQQPHDDGFGSAEAERPDGKGQQRNGQDRCPQFYGGGLCRHGLNHAELAGAGLVGDTAMAASFAVWPWLA
ncbi:hypothetical protein JCM25156A_28490 [Komagataeibacter kakiaceti JCM 25156]